MLHFDQDSTTASTPVAADALSASGPDSTASQSKSKPVIALLNVAQQDSTVLLSTARAEALDAYGHPLPVRILLDSASQSNFITEDCMRRGGFGRSRDDAVVLAINDTKAASTRGRTSLVIQVQGRGDVRIPIEATILPRISALLPGNRIDRTTWKHVEGLQLADPKYNRPGPIDILIGATVFTSLLRDDRRIDERGEPDAFNTVFEWVLLGSVSSSAAQPVRSFLTLDSIDSAVTRFWQLEEIPPVQVLSEEDRKCEKSFARTTRCEISGRFMVSYPFVGDNLASQTRGRLHSIDFVHWNAVLDQTRNLRQITNSL